MERLDLEEVMLTPAVALAWAALCAKAGHLLWDLAPPSAPDGWGEEYGIVEDDGSLTIRVEHQNGNSLALTVGAGEWTWRA